MTPSLKQSELTRCAKAMQAAGIDAWVLEIERDGKMRILVGKWSESVTGPDPDELLK